MEMESQNLKLILLLLVVAYFHPSCEKIEDKPTEPQIKQAVNEWLKKGIPLELVQNQKYNGQNPWSAIEESLTSFRIKNFGIKQKDILSSNPYWMIKVYIEGTCILRYIRSLGSDEPLFYEKNGTFQGEWEFRVNQDDYGKWIVS